VERDVCSQYNYRSGGGGVDTGVGVGLRVLPRRSRGLMEHPGWSSLLENIVLLLVIVPAQSGAGFTAAGRSSQEEIRKRNIFFTVFCFGRIRTCMGLQFGVTYY
jgi:hypothetical protein